jgi:putative ABC transport system permease protein
VTLVGTTTPDNLSSTQGGGTFTLKSGAIFDGTSTENVALLGTNLAEKNSLEVGTTFTAYSKSIKVVGTFDSGNNFSNNMVIMPLASVQTLTSQAGSITNAVVMVDSVSNIDSTTTAVKTALGDKADVTNSAETAKTVLAPLENIKSISMVSLIGSLVAGSVIILLTMMMIVRERRREIGVLKAIGATNSKVMLQFMIEAITLTVFGMVLGLAVGIFGSDPVTKLLVQNSENATQQVGQAGRGVGRMMAFAGQGMNNIRNIQTNVGWNIILYGFGVALVIAVVGSTIPAWFISKVRPAEVMRAE